MTSTSTIDLVLPVFNPELHWAETTDHRTSTLEAEIGETIHLIVVDDGSTSPDAFEELRALRPEVTVIHLPENRGKGYALREGMKSGNGNYVLFTDADFPYTLKSIGSVLGALQNGADIALGYREQDYYAKVPWFRKGLSELFRFVLRSLLRFPITDTQCGLKGMNEKGKSIFLGTSIERFLVDMEFIKAAVRQKNVSVVPVVVELRNDVTFSKMGVGVLLREAVNFLRILFQ